MSDIRKLLDSLDRIVEGVPTTFKATHFHKSNLFGAKNDLMYNPEDGKFYWKGSTGEIEPWQGNPNNRAGYNPASVDGEYVDGKPVEYPKGVTFADKQKEKAAGATATPTDGADQPGKVAAGAGAVTKDDPNKLKLSDGSTFSREAESNRLLRQKLAKLINRLNELMQKMDESAPVSLRGYMIESGLVDMLLEALSPAEQQEVKNIYGDLKAVANFKDPKGQPIFIDAKNLSLLNQYLSARQSKIEALVGSMPGEKPASTGAVATPVPDQPKVDAKPLDPVDKKPEADKPADAGTKFNKDEITGPEGGQYTIKPGDNLTRIAKAHGTTVDELLKLNPQIKDPNKIAAGAKLNVPSKPVDKPAEPKAEPKVEPKADIPTPGVEEPRSAAAVSADPENTGNAEDPEAQVFMQDTPTAARQLKRAILGMGTDEEAIFKVMQQVKSKADWDKLQAEYKKDTGNDLVADLEGDLDSTDMVRYVWDPLRKAGVTKGSSSAPAASTPTEKPTGQAAPSVAPGKMTMDQLEKITDDKEFLKALLDNPHLAKKLNINIEDVKKALGK